MKIYTRKGDRGTTTLVGGTRISKSSARLEAYGTLDEMMAHIGVLCDMTPQTHFVREELIWILSRSMDCAALLASEDTTIAKLPQITPAHVKELETWTDNHLDGLPALTNFTLPSGAPLLSYSHVCRTVCRRAERRIVTCNENGIQSPPEVSAFINRLSDYFYALGRRLGYEAGATEIIWK